MTDPVLAASEASPEEADALVAVLPPDSQEGIVAAWLEAEDGARLRALADGTACAASTRKRARKAIHILKTRGVHVPDAAKAPPPNVAAAPTEAHRAWLSLVDGAGFQVFVVAYGAPGGGFRGALGVRGGPEGVHEAVPFDCAKRRLKELVDHASADLGGRLVQTDHDYVRWRVDRAVRKGLARGSAVADRLAEAAGKWPPASKGEPAHPARALALPVSGLVGPLSFDEADRVLAVPEVGGWTPPPEKLEALSEALGAIDQSLLVVSPETQMERWMDAILDAVAEHFSEEVRREMALDLEDTALVVAATADRSDDAALLLRAAADVRDLAVAPAEVSFLRLYFERWVPPPPTGRKAVARPKRTKGGIVLP